MSIARHIFLQFVIIFLFTLQCSGSYVKLTRVLCTNLDYSYINITHCWTKPIRRDITETNIRVLLLQPPLTELNIKLKLMKKSNNYNQFYAEQNVDGCKFMAQKKRFPFIKQLYDIVLPFSNVNHTCPYEGELIVDRFRLDPQKFAWLPLPEGVYAFFSTWSVSGKPRAEVNAYFQIFA